MVTITATQMEAILDLSTSDITLINMEKLIDVAVNRLNTYRCELPNMTGTEGTKTLSVESREAGAIQEVTRIIYYGHYRGQENLTISGITITTPNMFTPEIETKIKELARQLTEMEVSLG